MGNVYMEAQQIRYKGQYRNVQEALDNAGGGGGGTTVIANPEGSATDDLSKLQVGTTIYGIPAEAGGISYDNASSGMTADDVQEAIDELSAAIPGVATTSAPGIVQPDGTSITISDGVISAAGGSGETYSTTETLIGTWESAPLYRKVIHIESFPNATTQYYNNVLPNNCDVKKLVMVAISEDNYNVYISPIPQVSISALNEAINYGAAKNKTTNDVSVFIITGTDRRSMSGLLIAEYTKAS